MITVRERRSPRSVWSTTSSPSHEIRSAVVSRWTGTSNWSRVCSRSSSTRSLASTRGWPGTSKIHFSGYSVVSWPPRSGSESMIRELASRMPAQKAVMRPTGPAPITVMSRISLSRGAFPFLLIRWESGDGRVRGHCLPVERVECPLDRGRDAGEYRRLALRVGARLRSPQLLDEVQELAGIVRVERNHEFLIVYSERIGGVDLDVRMTAPCLDVAAHDSHPLLARQQVPVAALPHGVDDQELPVRALTRAERLLLV